MEDICFGLVCRVTNDFLHNIPRNVLVLNYCRNVPFLRNSFDCNEDIINFAFTDNMKFPSTFSHCSLSIIITAAGWRVNFQITQHLWTSWNFCKMLHYLFKESITMMHMQFTSKKYFYSFYSHY